MSWAAEQLTFFFLFLLAIVLLLYVLPDPTFPKRTKFGIERGQVRPARGDRRINFKKRALPPNNLSRCSCCSATWCSCCPNFVLFGYRLCFSVRRFSGCCRGDNVSREDFTSQ